MKRSLLHRDNRGFAMILIMIILIVATGIGIWGLSSSRTNVQKAGSRRAATSLVYQSEHGLQMAVRRFQGMCLMPPVDPVSNTNNADTHRTGGNYAPKDMAFFLSNMCQEAMCGAPPLDCGAFDHLVGYDNFSGPNVDCNFLGVTTPETQVSIVRKDDLVTVDAGTFGIFLVNSIATDKNGRKQGIQGVVAVRYECTAQDGAGRCTAFGPDPCGGRAPYLVSSKTITE